MMCRALALGACDRVLGLGSTQIADGPGPDAPPSCPAIGTPPRFSAVIHQQAMDPCNSYSISDATGLATGECDPTGPAIVGSDGTLVPITLNHPLSTAIESIELSPRSNDIWAYQVDTTGTVAVYAQQDAATWAQVETPFSFPDNSAQISPPAFTATGRRVLVVAATSSGLFEAYEDSGTWEQRQILLPSGVTPLTSAGIYLSPDGLRMIFPAQVVIDDPDPTLQYGLVYADRADASALFGAPVLLSGVPRLDDGSPDLAYPFMTEDCGHLYVRALDQILYFNLSY